MSQTTNVDERRLNSWKEIAAYFGHDQRTVKRWEHSRGLPVRRLPGARSGVFALVSEVQAWQRNERVAGLLDPVTVDAADSIDEAEDGAAGVESGDEASGEGAEGVAMPEAAATLEFVGDGGEVGVLEDSLFAGPAGPEIREAPAVGVTVAAGGVRSRAWWKVWAVAAALVLVPAGAVGVWRSAEKVTPGAGMLRNAHVPPARARELYLEGRFRWNKRTPDDLKAAMQDFEQAVQIDPGYAAAYAGIADCFALQPEFEGKRSREVYPLMLQNARKAVALDPGLAEGHRALGFALFYWTWDRVAAEKEFARAVELAPNDATAHHWLANALGMVGEHERAAAEIERARELDPTSLTIAVDRGFGLYQAGQRDEALAIWKHIETTDPEYVVPHVWLAIAYLDMHKPEGYLRELQARAAITGSAADGERFQVLQRAFRAGGEGAMLQALADYSAGLYAQQRTSAWEVATNMVRAGRNEEALTYLRQSFADRDDSFPAVATGAQFAPLRGLPGFAKLQVEAVQPYPDGK